MHWVRPTRAGAVWGSGENAPGVAGEPPARCWARSIPHPQIDEQTRRSLPVAPAAPTEAIALLDEAIPLRRAKLGPEHRDTLASMDHSRPSLSGCRPPEEAIKLQEETLQLRREHLGPEHPDTFESMNNLAQLTGCRPPRQRRSGCRKRHSQLPRRATGPGASRHPRVDEQPRGPLPTAPAAPTEAIRARRGDPTQPCQAGPGASRHAQVDEQSRRMLTGVPAAPQEAIQLLEETLQLTASPSDPRPSHTLTSMVNLAYVFRSYRRTEAGIQLHEETSSSSAEHLGPEHPSTLMSMNNPCRPTTMPAAPKKAGQVGQQEVTATHPRDEHLGPAYSSAPSSVDEVTLANAYA